jgi:PAS domain S-box-containing protein
MNPTSHRGHALEQLLGFADALAGDVASADLLQSALPHLLTIAGADAVLVLAQDVGAPTVTTSVGLPLDHSVAAEIQVAGSEAPLTAHAVPDSWQGAGIAQVCVHALPGEGVVLVLAWCALQAGQPDVLRLGLTTLDACLARARSEERLADLATRVDHAQSLANMGDYDWHIPTDTNAWSDQLFRIYGHEPQSFQPSYDTFLSMLHPEDRDRVSRIHEHAYATGEPYQMIERIVRPDGQVRYLSSNGEVIRDADGQPVRMRGTCIDITDRVLADRERERVNSRFQGLVNSAPDAILVLAENRCVLEANERARQLLGGDPVGHFIEQILPGWPTHGSTGVDGAKLDGQPLRLYVVSVGVNPLQDDSDPAGKLVALFLRDAEPRMAGEALAARLGEAQLRRRQALEINDNVVQGIVAAVYALDQGETEATMSFLERTLSSARAMMDDLLDPLDGVGLQPGDLVRSGPATIGPRDSEAPDSHSQVVQLRRTHSVLVVDDADDLRTMLRTRMENYKGLTVVGEAADGVAAVEMAAELQPDLVLLDLAMPRMDGLEALPLIRAAVPGVRVIVLSGFNQSTLAQKALEAGADHYVVKGGSMSRLLELVDSLLEPAS